jgi:glycosyltransferase involved in cell wall biosynthesis
VSKILHITESLGGGVTTALHSFIVNAPQAEHYLLAAIRPGDDTRLPWNNIVTQQWRLPRAPWAAIQTIRQTYAKLQPDRVHLHSSYAGAWGRLAGLPRERIIYTPHCYAFERRDLAAPLRTIFYGVEQLLSFGGKFLAAVSPHEADLARRMRGKQQIIFLPNVATLPPEILPLRQHHQRNPTAPLRIAMAGRLAPQKDPAFFAATAQAAKAAGLKATFIWLGGGKPQGEEKLRAEGVQVSGWLGHHELLEQLARCDLYFHTAAWESCPMAILEAAALGIPIMARKIPSLDALPLQDTMANPAAAAEAIALMASGQGWESFRRNVTVINNSYTIQAQQQALQTLYAPSSGMP